MDRRVTLNHCQCTSPCPSQNCCSNYDVHQTLLHSNHWEPFSSDEDMKNVLERTVPLTCPSFTSECEESPRAVNCDAASLAAARCLAATWHFETNQNKAWKGLRVCASVLCTCVCVFVLLRGLYQQHNVNASRNAEAHNDFTAHRWAVQLCTLLLIAKRLIIEVNKRENTVTL